MTYIYETAIQVSSVQTVLVHEDIFLPYGYL